MSQFQISIYDSHTLISATGTGPLYCQPCCGPKDPLCEALTLPLCAHDSEPASQLSPSIPEPWEDGRIWYLCSSTLLCTHVYVNCMYFMCNLLFLLQQLLPLDCPSNNSCKMRPFKCSQQTVGHSLKLSPWRDLLLVLSEVVSCSC